ncbi:sugar kinase [Arthrobacter sp. zg-Y238]|uniref:sugar kinase n=1 Tax=Arthrobacter sp. zg-Y238 TaxID=2964614 RepID=UPI002103F508|nr:sugar kinase [Arthrobacter sp. zg-Y238]
MSTPSSRGPVAAAAGPEEFQPAEVVTLGETMAVLRSQHPGPLAHAGSLDTGIGGAESNVAIGLRRLGVDVAWVGRVGADSLGELVLRELRAEGLRVLARVDPEARTGLMIKERRTQETVKVWYYRNGSAGSRLTVGDVPAEAIAGARLLHITGITPALSASAAEAVRFAVDCAHDAGTQVSLDLNYRSALWTPEQAAPVLRKLIADADILFAGLDEAAIALGAPHRPERMAALLAGMGPHQVLLKLGPEGALGLIDGSEYAQDAVQIQAVDTVGAGDAFVAGYLAELLAGEGPKARLQTAVRTGAFACLGPGDWESLPHRNELGLLDTAEGVQR